MTSRLGTGNSLTFFYSVDVSTSLLYCLDAWIWKMLQVGFEPPTLPRSVNITIYVFNSVFPCWSVFFPIYGRKYSMKIKLFIENMWEFFLVFYFVPYKVNIPMHVGEFFYVFILFYTKLIFPCMQGDWNKSYIRNIFVGYKWKFTFQTKPLWGFATVYFLENPPKNFGISQVVIITQHVQFGVRVVVSGIYEPPSN